MSNRTQIKQQPITWKGTLGAGFLAPTRTNYFLWAKLQQISYKYLRKGKQRTRSSYPWHKVTPGIIFGRQCGRLYAGDTRSHSCVSDPASNLSSERCSAKKCTATKYFEGASPSVSHDVCCREMNILQCNMEQGWFFSCQQKPDAIPRKVQSWMPCFSSYPTKSEIMGRSIFTLVTHSKLLWIAQAQLTPANSLI